MTIKQLNIKQLLRTLFLIFYFLFLISYSTFAQLDSCHVRITLLTASPGEELYSTFGHSALRVTDPVTNEDMVYNYGTFNFDEPGFYTKFVRGKLLYYLSTQDFNSFKREYEMENRGMIEQMLNLSCNEKQKMVLLLQQNLMGENKFYKYDFLFDNCTTRLRDLLENSSDTSVSYSTIVKEKTTFRKHIFEYMDYNDKQWTKLGMDILLGNNTDKVMTYREAMFLPDYLFKGFDSGRIGNKPIVETKVAITALPVEILQQSRNEKSFFTSPFFVFWFLFIVIILMSFSKNETIKKLLYGFDGALFFITGCAGILMLFMWFGTEHIVCRNNYNLLWAWPTNVIAAFLIQSKKQWVRKYFYTVAVIFILVFLSSAFWPQQINKALIPIILLLIYRNLANGKRQIHKI